MIHGRQSWLREESGPSTEELLSLTSYSLTAGAQQQGPGDLQLRLQRIIESDIIPRLMISSGVGEEIGSGATQPAAAFGNGEVEEFSALLIGFDEAPASDYIEAMRAMGICLESLYLHMLAPAARYLGALWIEDRCSFADVTIGLCRLHRILRELGVNVASSDRDCVKGWRVLMTPTPGEQHVFGLAMTAEFFRRADWDVRTVATPNNRQLVGLVRRERFDLIGLTASCECHLKNLKEVIACLRKASCNKRIGVIVGGYVFSQEPALVDTVGADLVATDGVTAPFQAASLVTLRRNGAHVNGRIKEMP